MAEFLDSGKPVDLLRTVIKNSTNSGEVVLDPFAGIGALKARIEKEKEA